MTTERLRKASKAEGKHRRDVELPYAKQNTALETSKPRISCGDPILAAFGTYTLPLSPKPDHVSK